MIPIFLSGFQLNDTQLKPAIYSILVNPNNKIYVSDVSLYEIAIKKSINKLPDFNASINDVITVCQQDKFQFLPILHIYIADYESIPLFDNHRDPFDRLIIATALSENLPIITADEKFELYLPHTQLIET